MVKYREILRLTYLGISQENIAFSCGCARSTVQLIQKLAKSKVSSNLSRYHRSPGLVPAISKRRYRE